MACSLRSNLCISGLKENFPYSKSLGVSGFSSYRFTKSKMSAFPDLNIDFTGNPVVISDQNGDRKSNIKPLNYPTITAQSSICVGRAQRWWEKTLKHNMIEIRSAQALVNALVDAGDRLAIIDFYSPGCGGCKALHPKICQLAESNPDAIFLKVNFEELKTMCQALHVHVLPFFRFYRGGEGRLCSFSCTNATIKKFKDALAKHGSDRCCMGPAKGLDEAELERLALAGELSTYLGEGMLSNNSSAFWNMDPLQELQHNLIIKV